MTVRVFASARLPRSGSAALASGAVIQAVLGFEFVLAGLNKAADADFGPQFTQFVTSSPGAVTGPLAGLTHALIAPNAVFFAFLAQYTELIAGAVLLLSSLEVLRRRLESPYGAPHAYEPAVALTSAVAAFVLGGMSLAIYALEGAPAPAISPGFAFGSPIAIELFLVPLALAIAAMEVARFLALRRDG